MDNFTTNTLIYDQFLRKMVVVFLIIVSIIFVGFVFLYSFLDITVLKYITLLCAVQQIVWIIMFYFNKKADIDSLLLMYVSYIVVALFPTTGIFWVLESNPIIFFWYLLVPIGTIAFHSKYIVWSVLLTGIAIISSFLFSHIIFKDISFTIVSISVITEITVLGVLALIIFFSVIYLKIDKMIKSMQPPTVAPTVEKRDYSGKDTALYDSIIEFLETEKPFTNPDFNANLLADALHTNVNYISKAINAGGVNNFHTLITNYRINYAKSMLDGDEIKKFTIDYIYTAAGYKYRSTFNAAFKKITGMTPTEYIVKHKKTTTTL